METLYVIALVFAFGVAVAGTLDSIKDYYYNKYRNE